MNVHHLELFYYVARHGGIMEAVRNIPYGIQQPAVSGQVAKLEEHLGVALFQRRPFALTPEGEKLYQFIAPFFGGLEKMTAELQGGKARHITIGASEVVLREHLPELFVSVLKKFPGLKISLRSGYIAQLEELLLKDEVDLLITLLEGRPAPGTSSITLLELPVVLLVPQNHPVKSADELWKRDRIDDALICLPPAEPLCRRFQQWLADAGVEWFPSIEASSLELIEVYVAGGLGIGLTPALPGKNLPSGLRALPLKGFPPLVIGALWRGQKTPLIETILNDAQKRAKKFR